jgi:hypothetical protein
MLNANMLQRLWKKLKWEALLKWKAWKALLKWKALWPPYLRHRQHHSGRDVDTVMLSGEPNIQISRKQAPREPYGP